jgi:hypothetical protein
VSIVLSLAGLFLAKDVVGSVDLDEWISVGDVRVIFLFLFAIWVKAVSDGE